MIQEVVARFREKGATSPEMTMTAQELGLPPRFEDAMKGRLGAIGIFVDVGGKYFLDEAKLLQAQRQRAGAGLGPRGGLFALRISRMAIGLSVIVLASSNLLFVQSGYLRIVIVGLLVLWVALTVFQMAYLSKRRSRWGAAVVSEGDSAALAHSEHTGL
jgi:hypothetical protein